MTSLINVKISFLFPTPRNLGCREKYNIPEDWNPYIM